MHPPPTGLLLTNDGARPGTQRPLAMQPIALMAAHDQAGSRGKHTPTPWQTLNSTTRWVHTRWGGIGDGAHLDQKGYGAHRHACHDGEDAKHTVGRQTQG